MKIKKMMESDVDIGELDCVRILPTASRTCVGMETRCVACGKVVKDETFAGGFKAGHPNMILHVGCVPPGTKGLP